MKTTVIHSLIESIAAVLTIIIKNTVIRTSYSFTILISRIAISRKQIPLIISCGMI